MWHQPAQGADLYQPMRDKTGQQTGREQGQNQRQICGGNEWCGRGGEFCVTRTKNAHHVQNEPDHQHDRQMQPMPQVVAKRQGDQGLMQLMPATAARFGVNDSMDAAQNIKGGVAYLGWLLDRFGNDPVLVLAGYNAGEGNVQRYEGVPPFAETMDYVPKVLAAWQVAKGLCQTPPDLITDGCVFNVNSL
jgi:hypothetical protein